MLRAECTAAHLPYRAIAGEAPGDGYEVAPLEGRPLWSNIVRMTRRNNAHDLG